MRTLFAFIVAVAAILALLLSLRETEPPDGARTVDSGTADDTAWPCSSYSNEIDLENASATWSYRLCGRGSEERGIEVRFRNTAAAADSIEYRLWLTQPVDCATSPWWGPRTLVLGAGGASATEALAVSFAAYRGELWLCARRAGSGGAFTGVPRRARHGEAI